MSQKWHINAPATIGNVGPGFDCLGLAVSGLADEVWAEESDELVIESITGRQAELLPRDPMINALTLAAYHYFKARGKKAGLKFRLHRSLPLSGGLGASAASAVAGAVAASLVLGDDPKSQLVLDAALQAETTVAGRHLDNIAPCLLGGLTLIESTDPPRVFRVELSRQYWIVTLSPPWLLNTRESRRVLPENLSTKSWVDQMAKTAGLVLGLQNGDSSLIERSLVDLFAEPRRAPLIKDFNHVKRVALESGALGCSISGGGPTVFALCSERAIGDAVAAAMQKIWPSDAMCHIGKVDDHGVRIEREE